MSDEIAAEFELNNVELDAEFELTNEDNIDATFEIYASGTVWGNIDGNIENQTDLAEALNSKQDVLTAGDNITIEDNVISATDTTYTAGNGISIENNVISNTQTSAEWGNIEGNLSDQTDLKDALDTLDGAIDSNHREITNINNTIQNYGDIVSYDAADFATKNQGELADTSLQPGDNITELTNNAGFITGITSSDVTTALGYTPYNSTNPNGYITSSALNGYATESFVTNQGYITGIDGQDVTEALGYTPYNSTNPNGYISGIDSADVTNALGYTPYDDSNPDGYITSADLPTVNNSTITIQKNGSAVESFNLNQSNNETINITVPTQASDVNAVPTTRTVNGKSLNTNITLNASDVGALSDTTTINDLTTQAQQDALNSGATTTNIGQIATNTQNISDEVTNRQNADYNLQQQIDAITSASDVTDIVGTYAELQAYDTTSLPNNSIIKVLQDENRNDETTYYRWVITGGVGAWTLIGEEGPYYTKSDADSTFVPQTRTINNKALSSNITLSASDVGALPSGTTIGSGVLTIQKNGTPIDTFGANDTGNTTVNITVPTNNSELTNGAGYITSAALSGYVESTDLATVATTGAYSDLTGTPTIPAAQVQSDWNQTNTSAVDYIKNKPTIPSGVTVDQTYDGTSANAQSGVAIAGELTNYVESSDLATVATSGSYNDLTNKPSIPAAQVNSDWNAVSGVAQILNKPTIPTVPTNISAFNNDSGYITGIDSSDVTTALGYTPYNSTNPNGYITGITSSDVTTALGYTPYNSTNPSGYITGITSSDVTTALGYTPYNSTNPNGYITGITSSDVTTALGYTPCQADLSNCTKPYITETYGQFAVYGSWYRVWSDGFIEQGGSLKPSADSNALEIIFLKTYQGHPTVVTTASYDNGSYTANTSNCSNRNANMVACSIGDISTFNFYVNRVGTNWIVNWYACGY